MSSPYYFGEYVRFTVPEKGMASGFLGADNIVGDKFIIKSSFEDGERINWLESEYEVKVGIVDDDVANQVDVLRAKGWTVVTLLEFVAFIEEPKPGEYWGEVALIAYDPTYEKAFSRWVDLVATKLGDGIRPDLHLGKSGIQQIIDTNGEWFPSGRHPLPSKQKGQVIIKSERSATERMVTQARKGNLGCSIAGWVFILVLVALVIWILHVIGLF